MKRTKNEQKERLGKVVFGLAISLPVFLIILYFFPMIIFKMKGCDNTFEKLKSRNKTTVELPEFLTIKKPIFFKSRTKREGVETAIGMEFTPLNERYFKYEIRLIDDVNGEETFSGIVQIDKLTVRDDIFEIIRHSDKTVFAYKFTDVAKHWQIEIGIAKGKSFGQLFGTFKKISTNRAQNLTFQFHQD